MLQNPFNLINHPFILEGVSAILNDAVRSCSIYIIAIQHFVCLNEFFVIRHFIWMWFTMKPTLKYVLIIVAVIVLLTVLSYILYRSHLYSLTAFGK